MNQTDKDWIIEIVNSDYDTDIIEYIEDKEKYIIEELERIKDNAECNYTREELHKLIVRLKE